MSTIKAADTGSQLVYDENGHIVGNTKGITHLFDALHREYKKCNHCHKFYLLDKFPVSTSSRSKDGHSSLCESCSSEKIGQKPAKESADESKEGRQSKKDGKDIVKSVEESSYHVVSLLPDSVLLDELRNRGYHGNLQVTKTINI